MSETHSSDEDSEGFDADSIIDIYNVGECDTAIKTQIFKRSKCKNWATRSRTACATLRNRLLVPGVNGGEDTITPSAGHLSLKAAEKALANMTKFFNKLDACSIHIITLHGYRFLDDDYLTEFDDDQRAADTTKQTLLETEGANFTAVYTAELNAMQNLLDKLEAKLHGQNQQHAPAADQVDQSDKSKQWRENRMFKPTETLSTKTPSAKIDYWADSMETYADSSNITKAKHSTQHAFMKTCVDDTFWNTVRDTIRDDAPLFPPNKDDRGGDSVMEKLREAHAIHNPLAANRLILFTRHQAPDQPFEEYHADLFWVYNRCDVSTLTDMKLFSYLVFMGIRDSELREAVVTRVKGDDSKITIELMLEVAKTRTTLQAYNEMVAKKDNNVVAYTSPQGATKQEPVKDITISQVIKGLSGKAKQNAMYKARRCFNCGNPLAKCREKEVCPGKSATCKKCNNKGHFQFLCIASPSVGKMSSGTTAKKPEDEAPTDSNEVDSD